MISASRNHARNHLGVLLGEVCASTGGVYFVGKGVFVAGVMDESGGRSMLSTIL